MCWAVGRANAALAPAGRVTQKALCAQLGLASFPSAKGRTVVAAEERAAAHDKARMPEQLIDEAEVL